MAMSKGNMPGYKTKGTTDGKKVDTGVKAMKKTSDAAGNSKPDKNTAKSVIAKNAKPKAKM